MASAEQVEQLLERFRRAIDASECVLTKRYYTKRDGSKITYFEAMVELNITKDEAFSIVRSLQPSDYRKGPEEDRDRPEEGKCIWVFKPTVKGDLIYIKLKFTNSTATILSLHKDW